MYHADFCVMPRSRPTSWEDIPFLQFTIIHLPINHLSSGSGESSKIVPTFTENCFLHPRHFQIRRVDRNVTSEELQRGHSMPPGQRMPTMKLSALSASAKYFIAS